ncbi:hypothetical protein [Rufibacter latericius]|uniref:HTTM domain-containing protein n=1 Tax=Rufibacter latericius TaxID=2487040 RepID=A0A3M9MKZ9_9BACT|nr:hypothetical protein [Rufibacter latericius]RNI26252.1 hypothetical protein EFB08_15710 [Rufibacter latericius]
MQTLYAWINKVNALFWERICRSTTPENVKSLSAFRIVVGFFLLAGYVPNFSWIAAAPQALFTPPLFSLATLFDGFPGHSFFYVLDGIVLLSLVCVILGIKARASTLVFLAACLVGLNFNFSFGKIDHSILIYALLLCMAFSGWGKHLALWPDKESRVDSPSKSLSLLSILLCFAMFSAGFEKAISWLDLDPTQNGFMGWFRDGYYTLDRHYLLARYVNYFPPALLEIFDYTAVVFELSPLFFLLHSRKAWRLWLLVACIFHVTNTFLLNIPFMANSMVYLAFTDFTWLYERFTIAFTRLYVKALAAATILVLFLMRAKEAFIVNPSASYLSPTDKIELKLYLGLLLWTIAITLLARSILRQTTPPEQKPQKAIDPVLEVQF